MDTNLIAVFGLTQLVGRHMLDRRSGVIVNIASPLAVRSRSGRPPRPDELHNFWLWGPPPAADADAIAVNLDPAFLRCEFNYFRMFEIYTNGLGVSDDEQGVQIYVVTGLRSSWASAWPAFRDYA